MNSIIKYLRNINILFIKIKMANKLPALKLNTELGKYTDNLAQMASTTMASYDPHRLTLQNTDGQQNNFMN